MRLFLISNMYPSKSDKLYGVFVKNMRKEFERQGAVFAYRALIKGRATTKLQKLKKYFNHYVSIIRYFFKSDYDLLYVHYYSHHVPVMWLLSGFKKTPWVVNVHGTDVIDLIEARNLDYLAKIVLKKVDLLVVPSAYYKALVTQHYPFLNPEKIFISPSSGVDLTSFQPALTSKTTEKLILGFVSRFEEAKGWKVYLKALTILKQKNIPFKGNIIGKGPDESKIKAAIQTSGLNDSVEFIGFVKQSELGAFYKKMDLYIFPSYRESLGLTGLEAMACGIPVIGSAIAGLKTYIKPGENGFLFEPGNAEDLVAKVEMFNLNGTDRIKFQKNARETAEMYERTKVNKDLIEKLKTITQ